jgi:hypothetical protein
VFYLEQLQPDWLPSRWQQWMVTTGPAVLLGIVVTIALHIFLYDFSVLAGLAVGAFAWRRTIQPVERIEWSRDGYWRRLPARLGWGLLVGAAIGVTSELTGWLNRPHEYIIDGEVFAPPGLGSALSNILRAALAAGLIAGVIGGFLSRAISPQRAVPNQGIRRSARRALLVLLFGLVIVPSVAVLITMNLSPSEPGNEIKPFEWLFIATLPLILTVVLLLPVTLWAGGQASLQHLILRILLVQGRAASWKYVRFLDEATDRLFLRKVGGGYVFVHRLLLDYFADLPKAEGQQMTQRTSSVSPAHQR